MSAWFWLALGLFGIAAVLFLLFPSTRAAILKLFGGASGGAEVDRLLSQHREVLQDKFSLCPGEPYVVLRSLGPLTRGARVVYLGTHQEPADRGWDYFHHFEAEDGQLLTLPLERTPRTVADSLLVFANVEHPDLDSWRNPTLMLGLHHRARRIREITAAAVKEDQAGITEAIPRLYRLALTGGDKNPFQTALQRIADQALPIVSTLDDTVEVELQAASERILAELGSKKHVARYREALLSADPIELRRAIKHIAQIGDRLAEPRLQELTQHSNMNVRFAVRDALAKLAQLEPQGLD